MMTIHPGVTGRRSDPVGEREAEAAEASEIWLPAPQLCKRHGISQMSLWRRLRDARLNFPRPIIVSGRRYFRLSEVRAWESAMRSKVA